MQYQILTLEEQQTGLLNRMRDLEVEHYGNTVFMKEAATVGDDNSINVLRAKNAALDIRYAELNKQLEEVKKKIAERDADDEK